MGLRGQVLMDYQILDEGNAEDANLRVQVKIKLGGHRAVAKPPRKRPRTSSAPVPR